jgi:23S rRNA (cytidine1920-2'-O)/16S rRNA (cytidine1409-2'-O)-methyltransferase
MRLDLYLAEKSSAPSRSRAALIIKKGLVNVNGGVVRKPSFEVSTTDSVEMRDLDYSSQGGYKLELALDTFVIGCKDKVCVDIGASNGGFTDCLLSRGAARVYCVDVGECALAKKLLNDPRVVVKDRLNARYITPADIGEAADISVIDVSYISLKLILPAVKALLKPDGIIIALIKPQFEAGRGALNKKGIVTQDKDRRRVIGEIEEFCISIGLSLIKSIEYKPFERGKNIEYPALIVLSKMIL